MLAAPHFRGRGQAPQRQEACKRPPRSARRGATERCDSASCLLRGATPHLLLTTSTPMATREEDHLHLNQTPKDLANYLGVRRTMTLKRIIRQTGLPPEVLLDIALEMLAIASRKLAPSPIGRQAVGLGAARWRNVSPLDRSDALRRVAQARWAKERAVKNKKRLRQL